MKTIKDLFSDILWGLLLDTFRYLRSLAGMFVLLPVYGFIYDLSRIGLQSVDSEDNF